MKKWKKRKKKNHHCHLIAAEALADSEHYEYVATPPPGYDP